MAETSQRNAETTEPANSAAGSSKVAPPTGYIGQPGDGEAFRIYRQGFEAGAASRQGEVDRLRRAIQAVIPHFLDQPQVVMNHNDYDPYETGPAYLGPQEPVDALRELVRE